MNAIIIAAGSGKRIGKDVKDLPKSLVTVNGKPVSGLRLVKCLRFNGLRES